VHKPLSGPSAGVFAGCVERLAEAFLAEPSDDTLFNILALPKAGLAPGLKQDSRLDWSGTPESTGRGPSRATARHPGLRQPSRMWRRDGWAALPGGLQGRLLWPP
jgi:hypothetical protein